MEAAKFRETQGPLRERYSKDAKAAFLTLRAKGTADNSTVTYLCSTGYNPSGEHGINPLDPELGIEWPTQGRDGTSLTYELSGKDTAAPSLTEARDSGLLPTYDDVTAYLRSLAE